MGQPLAQFKEISMSAFDYELPEERIAKYPAGERDKSRLLLYADGVISERSFSEVPELFGGGAGIVSPSDADPSEAGDPCNAGGFCATGVTTPDATSTTQTPLLVFNNTRVIHARLLFRKETGAAIEIFCLEPYNPSDYAVSFASMGSCEWRCLVGNLKKWHDTTLSRTFSVNEPAEQGSEPTKRGREKTEPEGEETPTLDCKDTTQKAILCAEKVEMLESGEVVIRFTWHTHNDEAQLSFAEVLEACGKIPIPPYLNRDSERIDDERYQTIYSKSDGSVAAPTAGLHFTEGVLERLRERGVEMAELTLHVGAGTFRPVKTERIGGHDMHTEHFSLSRDVVEKLIGCSGNVVAVGTTSVRALESLYWMGVKLLLGREDFNHIAQWEVYELEERALEEVLSALLRWFEESGEARLEAETTIVIVPGYHFRIVNYMFTNFHQPHSTLLLLVAAAIGEDWRRVYDYALANGFRFLSYGDSSLLKIK